MPFNAELHMTFPVVIMRSGGLDGVALQAQEYRKLLNRLDINVQMITGRNETKFATHNPIGNRQTVVSRLDFYHKDSVLLFANQFKSGPEKTGIAKISDKRWLKLFESHKKKLFAELDKIIQSCCYNTPVLVYNLVSLRHAHPAAAAALRELILKYPKRPFISHSADPDAERPEKIARIKTFALEKISANALGEPYSGGPYNFPNLYHIVLNPTQRENFLHKYAISADHIFEIPDFLEFSGAEPNFNTKIQKIFLQFVAEHKIKPHQKQYQYTIGKVEQDAVFFVSPVRPVYRKRLKEAMLVARHYAISRKRQALFIVTHPNIDDTDYFIESVKFAEKIGLPYYHLGRTFSLEALDQVYESLAPLNSIGVIASAAGGWENALNEMARGGIPFYMDKKLNSYVPLTQEIGMQTCGIDFGAVTPQVEEIEKGVFDPMALQNSEEAEKACKWIDSMLQDNLRLELTKNNYHKAYAYLSHDATMPKLIKSIEKIYELYDHSPEE